MTNSSGSIKRGLRACILAFFVLTSTYALSQQRSITGKVTDSSDGIGLPGVTVLLEGTQNGAITDIDGKYTLSISGSETLVFSYVGYETVKVQVGQRSVIDVALEVDAQELSEVVVIGYGKVEEGDITGVVSKISEESFNKGMMNSPEQLLAGKVAGVQVTSNSGEPGGGITIRMRGGTSLLSSNDPLYVVDGVALSGAGVAGTRNPLSFINPADIEDITILKDASSAAIYGSRGANGVVIITTKTGKEGKIQVSYDGSVSVSNIIDRVEMLNTDEFVFTLERNGPRNLARLGSIDPETNERVYADTDWLGEVTQNAVSHNHNLGVSFGSKSGLTGRTSINYQDIDGVLKTSNTERIAASVNLTQKLFNDNLTITWNSKHAVINNRFAPNVVGSALVYAPTQPVRLNDSTYFQWNSNLAPRNPVEQIETTINIGQVTRNLFSGQLEYKLPFISGLSIKGSYSHDISEGKSQVTNKNISVFSPEGSFSYSEESRTSDLFEAYLNYNTKTSIGQLDLLGGYSYQEFKFDKKTAFGLSTNDSQTIDSLGISDPFSYLSDGRIDEISALTTNNNENDDDDLLNRLISFWGRANLSIKDKYLLTATLRRDGSTKFGNANKWGYFPSFAVGWRVIDEPFMDGLTDQVQNLKLRVSYGITGNQDIADYRYVETYTAGNSRAAYILGQDTINTLRPQGVDPNVKWEQTASTNIGIDYGFLDGRLTGSVDIYRKNTTDQLFDIAFPVGTLTRDRAITNIGEVENRGIEFLINSIVIDKQDMRLNLSFNAAYNKNEIIALDNSNLPSFPGYNDSGSGISGDVGQTIQILRVGQPLYSFYVYEHKEDANGNPLPDQEDHNGDGSVNDADMYVDQVTVDSDGDGILDSSDGIINEDDLIAYKNAAPDWIFGLTANFSFKKFDLAATFRAQTGNYTYNNVASQYGTYDGVNNNFSPNNIHTSAYDNDFSIRDEKLLLSSAYIENASFLRLDNITVGYSFQANEKLRSRVYFTANNILTLSGYSGIDPEAGGFRGIDNNLYPRSRTFLLGINVTLN